MKILMVAPQFRPLVGGYERAAEQLSMALVRRGHRVTVLTERRRSDWPKHETFNGVQIRRWFCVYRPGWHVVTSVCALFAILIRMGRDHDVWHVHQYGTHSFLVLVVGRLLRRQVVVKVTSSGPGGIGPTLAAGPFPGCATAIHRRAPAVVALTAEAAAEVSGFGISLARIHILGNGVDVGLFRPPEAARRAKLKRLFGLADTKVLVFVGSLRREKNVALLLEAWSKALPRVAESWLLVILGEGPDRKDLERRIQATDLAGRVRIAGGVANVADWFASSDLFVLSSDREGLSNALLEAFATGLPAVVTRVSGVSECVEQPGTGLVVPTNDAEALSDAIVALANDERRRFEMGARARLLVEQRYAIDQVAEAYERLYERLSV